MTLILLVGASGCGKSTLINAVADREVAATGVGLPVTTTAQAYQVETDLTLVDSVGFELGNSHEEIWTGLATDLASFRPDLIWYCLRSHDRRFTTTDKWLITHLSHQAPIVVVLTKSDEREADSELARHIDGLALPIAGMQPVRATEDPWRGPAHGVPNLLGLSRSIS